MKKLSWTSNLLIKQFWSATTFSLKIVTFPRGGNPILNVCWAPEKLCGSLSFIRVFFFWLNQCGGRFGLYNESAWNHSYKPHEAGAARTQTTLLSVSPPGLQRTDLHADISVATHASLCTKTQQRERKRKLWHNAIKCNKREKQVGAKLMIYKGLTSCTTLLSIIKL